MVSRLCLLAACIVLAGVPAAAQTQVPFSFRVQQGSTSATVPPGSAITLPANGVGEPATITMTATYQGNTSANVTAIGITGSSEITVTSPPLPVTLQPGTSITFVIRYLPSSTARATGQLAFVYNERPATGPPTPSNTISFVINGVTPDFVIAYTDPATSNQIAVPAGGVILFPETLLGTETVVPISIVNRGSGPGLVGGMSLAAERFSLTGLPLFPVLLDSGRELRVSARYRPTTIGTDRGTLTVTLNEKPVVVRVEGSAVASQFTYEMLSGDDSSPFVPNSTVTLPDTNIGDRTSVSIRVRNTGNAPGQIASISILGQAFQLADLPILPLTLSPGSATIFTLTFAPVQAGRASGRLRIGSDIFEVAGIGIGPLLSFSSSNGSSVSNVAPGGTVIFSPVAVGSSNNLDFVIQNTGTTSAAISSITLTDPRSEFALQNLPPLPASIPAQGSLRIPIRFAPRTLGALSDVLRIDGNSFTLSGTGLQPPRLPDYTLSGPPSVLQPLDQPSVSLTLAETYPMTISGTLNLTFNSSVFAADPSVQFATGGTSVSFNIPAGTRNAVFSNNAASITFQAGTVAGQLTLSPTFSTGTSINLTPDSPKTLTMTVPALAPRIVTALVAARGANSVTLQITGYATDRTLKELDLTLAAVPDAGSLATSSFKLPLDGPSSLWFRSGASQGFGGLFAITLPLTVSGGSTASPADVLQSASVTLSNDRGRSNTVTVELR